jgi:hypothetical protein
VPLTLLWILLIYRQPIISASGVPTTVHQLMVHGLIALGLWLGLESTDLTLDQRRTTWLAVMIPYTLWMAVAWNGAINGVFRTGTRLPALPLAIFLPVSHREGLFHSSPLFTASSANLTRRRRPLCPLR